MNLTTNYLGLELKNPIVPSAGPLSHEIGNIKAMEDAGAAAVVLYSLFEEEIEHESLELYHHTTAHQESFAEALDYFPEPYEFKVGPEKYIEQAGADALELNIYFLASNAKVPGSEIEREYLNIVKAVKMNVNIPIAVKMHPFFSSVSWMAEQLSNVGADGLVLFNRFYQPDINLETLEVEPNVLLSTPMAMRLPLRWIAMLYGKVNVDLAATSGIYTEADVIKMIMAGAKVTHMLSCLLKFGIGHIKEVLNQMVYWMEVNEYESLEQLRRIFVYNNVANPSQFERVNYMKVLNSYK